ncbi:hypothetical protein BW730_13720 [Tessaracoccus aquimaris]|uniref:ABC transporter domain-containing protein n=1 Tax=Tessaracoccus aquimaris TaxID=1332264 RepID=A0A1Q2CTF5_9ACTN|nr:hypothetical protein BW730_13720 [Tessaracoccus aquimaris]
MLRVRGVHHSYPDGTSSLAILRGVDVDVASGQAVAITGRSGSGKSTLLHIVTGLLVPSEGNVEICGVSLDPSHPAGVGLVRRTHVGLSSPRFGLHQHETVASNVELPLLFGPHRSAKRDRAAAVKEALGRAGIAALASRRARELSTGQAQRVALARAIVKRPALLVVDEPTAALDEETSAEMVALLRALTSDGMAILTATHDPQVSAACDKVAHLADGVLNRMPVSELRSENHRSLSG